MSSIKIDEDGYVVYRTGGRLTPRVTYRYSTVQRAAGEANLDRLRVMADTGELLLLGFVWDIATFYEDQIALP